MFEKEIDRLINANKNNSLVIFVGSGISLDSNLPKWKDIIVDMYEWLYGKKPDSNYNFSSDEYLTIPQKVYDLDEEKYKEIFQNSFKDIKQIPNRLDDLIVKLKPDHIITTNYDQLLEKSLLNNGLSNKYGVVYDDASFINKAQNYDHYLIKMHGDLNDFESMVLKENDYLNYENKRPFTSNFINTLLSTHVFLFVGYSMSDYNFKIILNRTNDFRSKVQSDRLYNSIWVNKVRKNYDIEHAYFNKNNVDIVNLNMLNPDMSTSENLFRFLSEISSKVISEGIYDDSNSYEKLNYVSHFEIDSLIPNIEIIGGTRIFSDRQFNDILQKNNALTNLFNKTFKYTVMDNDNGDKIEKGNKINDVNVYNKVMSGAYNEIDYKKENLSLKDKQYLFHMFGLVEKLNNIEPKNDYDLDKFNSIIINHNFEMINPSYKLVNTDRMLKDYYIFKIIMGDILSDEEYDRLLSEQVNKYDLSNNEFYFELNTNNNQLESYGNLETSKDLAHDLFRYEIVNRLILNKSNNIRVFKLFFQCVLCTYNHNVNREKTLVNVQQDYQINHQDFVVLVNKLDINDIQQMINDYNIEFLKFIEINKIVSYIKNLCDSYIENDTVENRDFNRKISIMISKSIMLLSFSDEMNAEQMSIIVNYMYKISLKGDIIESRRIYDIFNEFFVEKIIADKKERSYYDGVFVKILKNEKAFSIIFGGSTFNVSLSSFLRAIVNRNYSMFSDIDVKKIISFNNLIYSCVFIPVLLDNGEEISKLLQLESDTIILSLSELITNNELSTKDIDDVFKELIHKSYNPNSINSALDFRVTQLLNLKSLGAKMSSNDKHRSYNTDHYRKNRLFGFIVDDINFNYKDIDILDSIWISAIKFDINNNYYIVNKLQNHKKELLNSSLKYKLNHGLLDENEMLVLMSIGFTVQELIKI